MYFVAGKRLNKSYDIEVAAVTIPTDGAAIERGRHLVETIGFCQECHEDNLAGNVMDDDPLFGRLVSANLTSGKGGIGSGHSDEDLVRAIRHGVDHDGTPLVVMPANVFANFSDADLGAIIAYVKSVPPVDNELPDLRLGPLGRVFLVAGMIPAEDFLPAEAIDHTAPRPPAPERAVTAEYGKYLAAGCRSCHGDNLTGKEGETAGPNITPAGNPGKWVESDFIRTMRTGVTPESRELDEDEMPWKSIARLTDDELKALWLYLQSVPAVETD